MDLAFCTGCGLPTVSLDSCAYLRTVNIVLEDGSLVEVYRDTRHEFDQLIRTHVIGAGRFDAG